MIDKTMKALTFSEFGSPDVLEYQEVDTPTLEDGEVLVEMKAIGLNYADIYRRKGDYHLEGEAPYINGYEGAGIIVKSRSSKYEAGDRVGFADVPFANAQYVAVPEIKVIPFGEEIDFPLAASVLLQGLTAQYLSTDSYEVKPDDTVLIHAASGGVGQILTQICKLKGAEVIGMTRSESKIETILARNADHAVILDDNWKPKIMDLTDGEGVDTVYDSVGITLMDSFEVTKKRGHVVFFGMAGGDPEAVDPRMLMEQSKTLTGADLWNHLSTEEERMERVAELFTWILDGDIQIKDPVKFKLSEGKKAHQFIETGKSSGKVLLIPER
ncbi:MAG: quinone oxidoreductase [Balneolaceae bacterium]|jgi:NADPH2:quinone reductase